MAFSVESVVVELSNNTISYYERLGYEIPRKKDKRGRVKLPRGSKIEVKIKDLPEGSTVKLVKQCDKCGTTCNPQRYVDILASRKNSDGKDYCSNCSYDKRSKAKVDNVPLEKSLAVKMPRLINEWHTTKNEKTPWEISFGSSREHWWICLKCGSDYPMSAANRMREHGCPFCTGRKINETNCLASTHPHLINEWDYTTNSDMTPYKILKGSTKKVWWICPNCNSKYDMSPNARTSKNHNCPYCSGKRVNHTNSLATKYPDFIAEWNNKRNNNITPFNILPMSNKKVWWTCLQCNNEFDSTPANRIAHKQGCPVCNESKGEKRIREHLELNNVVFKTQYTFENLIGVNGGLLKFDFAIFNKNGLLSHLIEYDGEFHFRHVYKGDNHKIIKKHDKIKNKHCKASSISLIRIPYWNFNKIEEILGYELSS